MTGMSFDYARAWKDLALPLMLELPPGVRDLAVRVFREAEEQVQDRDLNVTWPKTGLKEAFDQMDTTVLAVSAAVVYRLGHWLVPKDHQDWRWLQVGGTYWKYTNYANQTLTRRLGVARDNPEKRGDPNMIGLEVIDGGLRVFLTLHDDSWTWYEVGPATEPLVTAAKLALKSCPPRKTTSHRPSAAEAKPYEDAYNTVRRRLRDAFRRSGGLAERVDLLLHPGRAYGIANEED